MDKQMYNLYQDFGGGAYALIRSYMTKEEARADAVRMGLEPWEYFIEEERSWVDINTQEVAEYWYPEDEGEKEGERG